MFSSPGSIGGCCSGLLLRRCSRCASWSSGSPPRALATASYPWLFGCSRSAAVSCFWFMPSTARTWSSSPARRSAYSFTCAIFISSCGTAESKHPRRDQDCGRARHHLIQLISSWTRRDLLFHLDLNGNAVVIGSTSKNHQVATRGLVLTAH